ncbi:MAG: hypothetical protein J7K31_04075 [Candidatus Aenigmarchaeota archaeon]|nr:hypothetical protein [Candidatus Aenigmarchaeota archaeon]
MLMREILKKLKKEPKTLEKLSKEVKTSSKEVIEALKSLKHMQLVYYEADSWHLTEKGLDVAKRMKK